MDGRDCSNPNIIASDMPYASPIFTPQPLHSSVLKGSNVQAQGAVRRYRASSVGARVLTKMIRTRRAASTELFRKRQCDFVPSALVGGQIH